MSTHCAEYSELFWSVFSRIRAEYGEIRSISLYSVRMRENTDQNNSKYGNFSCSDYRHTYQEFRKLISALCNQANGTGHQKQCWTIVFEFFWEVQRSIYKRYQTSVKELIAKIVNKQKIRKLLSRNHWIKCNSIIQ